MSKLSIPLTNLAASLANVADHTGTIHTLYWNLNSPVDTATPANNTGSQSVAWDDTEAVVDASGFSLGDSLEFRVLSEAGGDQVWSEVVYFTGAKFQLVSNIKSLQGSAGMTDKTADRYRTSHYSINDENAVEIDLGFTVSIGGNSYSSVWVNSNSYITFGADHQQFSNFDINSSPDKPTLFLGAEDGSNRHVYEEKDFDHCRIRFEGSDDWDGSPINTFWECTFYNPSAVPDNKVWIEVVFGTVPHNKNIALFGIGGGGSSIVPLNGGNIVDNNSYVFEGDSNGINWVLNTGSVEDILA